MFSVTAAVAWDSTATIVAELRACVRVTVPAPLLSVQIALTSNSEFEMSLEASGSSSHAPIDLTGVESSSESEGGSDNDGGPRGAEYDDDDDGGSAHGSDDSEIEITLNDETRAQLHHAIATVSAARLRALISALVEADVQIEALLTRELVTVKRGTQEPVPLWEMCGNCGEEFETTAPREETECVFHPGILEPSEESAVDWDFDAHGPVDTAQNRKQYPDLFKWTCCDEDGAASGCVQNAHEPHVSRKRKRVEE